MGNTKIWVVILFLFISLGIYSIQAGWFSEIEIKERENAGWVLTGVEYEGKLNSKEFSALYDSISREIEKGNLKGELAALFFENPNTDKRIKAVVGALYKDKQEGNYYSFTQKAYHEYYSEITLGELFTPNPENVIDMISESAAKDNSTAEKLYLESYPSKTQVVQSVILH